MHSIDLQLVELVKDVPYFEGVEMRRYLTCAVFLLTIWAMASPNVFSESENIGKVERVSPQEARQKIKTGKALLVCAYDDATCKDMVLDGALLRSEFESRLASISKNQEIIFYCA